MSTTDLVNQYVQELRGLTLNSKPIINTLTMIASENKPAAAAIAAAVEARINSSAPAHKLPALYLLDSIVKNIGLPYTALFAGSLPQVYMSVWLANPSVRPSLTKLYNTWQRFFPEDVLSTISQRQNAPEQAAPELIQPLYPAAAPSTQPHYHHPPPFAAQPNLDASRPAAWGNTYGALPQPHQSNQLPPRHPSPAYAPYPYQTGVPAQPESNPYAAAYTPTYPQPQYTHGPSPNHPPVQSTPPYGVSAAPADAPVPADFLSQLISAGLIPAGRGSGVGGAAAGPAPVAPVVMPRVFNLGKYKDWSETALKQLMDGTAATHSKFLDRRLHKKQRLSAGVKSSRQYYVKASDWLAGTSAVAQAVPAFFEEEDQGGEKEAAEEQASVPADPDQPNCAISGESFDSFWDDATNGWRYKEATALDAEQAASLGYAEGTLVKISCLAPAVSMDIRGASEALEAIEGQAAAEELAAAVEDETADPAIKEDTKDVEDIMKKHQLEGLLLEESPKRQKTERSPKSLQANS